MGTMPLVRYELRYWRWRGWRTRYAFRSGAGSLPVVCVHGFGASADHWRDNLPDLSEMGTAYAIDLVGFGQSQKPPTRYHIRLWAEQVYEFWQSFIGVPCLLIGNSIGALVVAIAAHEFPEMTKGLVCISLPDVEQLQAMIPAPLRPIQQGIAWIVASMLAKPLFYLVRSPKLIENVLKKGVYVKYPDRVDAQLVRIICDPTLDPQAPEAFLRLSRSLNQPNYSPNLVKALQELQIPVLILWGTKDMAIPPAEGKRLIKFLQDGELLYLEALGHCPHDEAPQEINQAIRNWVQAQFNELVYN